MEPRPFYLVSLCSRSVKDGVVSETPNMCVRPIVYAKCQTDTRIIWRKSYLSILNSEIITELLKMVIVVELLTQVADF